MIKNNISIDLKTKIIENNINQTELAEKLGLTRQQINRLANNSTNDSISKSLVNLFEFLGYDIEINYIKKEK